jgi:hypothetical protein
MNPAVARQKFYAPKLPAGCLAVCFYNHTSADLGDEDQKALVDVGTRLWSDAPYMSFMETPTPVMVWVDFDDTVLKVGLMLQDQTAIGYIERKGYSGVADIVAAMEEHSAGYRSREDNIPARKVALDDPSLAMRGIHQVARTASRAMNRRDFGRSGLEQGEN